MPIIGDIKCPHSFTLNGALRIFRTLTLHPITFSNGKSCIQDNFPRAWDILEKGRTATRKGNSGKNRRVIIRTRND